MSQESNLRKLLKRKRRVEQLYENWEPHPKQKLVLDALKRGKKKFFIRAGRRSGKTEIVCHVATSVAGLKNNSTSAIITPSLKQANRIYWKKRKMQNFPPSEWVIKEKNDDLTLYFDNTSYIELDGSENIDAHRGDEKDFVALDEYKDIDSRFYSEVIEPMFATTDGIVMIIGTPPETPDSHFRELEEAALKDDSWEVIHWTSYDNPYVNKEWLDKKREELTLRGEEDVFKREYLAEYTRGGKNSVFPMLARTFHVKKQAVVNRYFHSIKDECELYWGNDPGTSTTFGSLFFAYRRQTGQILIMNEIYAQDKSKTHTDAIVEEAKGKINSIEPDIQKWQTFYDDAAVWFANEVRHRHGITALPANKAAKSHEEGISLIKSLLLKKNAIVISDSCENLLKEMENYIMLNGKYPLKDDHLIDIFRYFLIFAHVILSLAENGEIADDDLEDALFSYSFKDTGLPKWIQ